jgi:TolB-like protein/DNA-binding winged helix-turn-helix (wHTH) protein/Tfp pilus assembly protein PilF
LAQDLLKCRASPFLQLFYGWKYATFPSGERKILRWLGQERVVDSDFKLGEWVVAPKLNTLSSNGKIIRVEPKVMQVLICLAETGDVVSKQTLMRTVWADTFVTDDVLTRSISELRKAFADDPKNPHYIQTIPKGGYRLIATVSIVNGSNGAAHGLADGPSHTPAVTPTTARFRLGRPAAIALAVGAAAVLLVFYGMARRPARPQPPAGRDMLAVLPFQNLNNDPEHDYYADGLTAEMISQLGRFPSDRLGVIAWNSMIRYKGTKKDENEIAWELGANYVLEGTVRRSGNQLSITAELVHIGDRSHVWANSYDGELGDVLALQNRVAKEIASEIQLRLTPEQESRLVNPIPLNPEGYSVYLQSKFSVNRGTEAEIKDQIEKFQQAIQLNPGYAPPYVGMAVAYRRLASEGFAPTSAYVNAQAVLEKSLQIDPTMAEAHEELGWVEWRGNWNYLAAEKEFRGAIEMNPGDAQAHSEYSLYLKSMGRYQEALDQNNAGIQLNPMDSYMQANAGHLLALIRRYGEASEHFRKALEIAPNQPYVHERFGAALLWQGQTEQAIAEFEKARELSRSQPEKMAWLAYAYAVSNRRAEALGLLEQLLRIQQQGQPYLSPFHIALVYAGLGDSENAFHWLDQAVKSHDEWLVYLRVYPEFQSLRSDARFQALERRVGLIQ